MSSKASAATITTDQHDYAPNSIAAIYGSGFAPNETVTLVVHHDDPATPEEDPWDIWLNHEPFSAQADANGNFVSSWYVASDCLGASLLARATGDSSGLTATTRFTDASSVGTLELWFNRAGSWGGTANGTNSGWKENNAVPMRWYADKLTGGTTYRLYLQLDYKKDPSGNPPIVIHFSDSIYQYDLTPAVAGTTMPDDTSVITVSGSPWVSGGFTTLSIPTDNNSTTTANVPATTDPVPPANANNNEAVVNLAYPDPVAGRVIKVWGGTATWVGYQTRVGGVSGSGGWSKYAVIDVLVAGTGNTQKVMVGYGAHLASRKDYGLGQGASRWPGGSGFFGVIVDEGADGANLSGVTKASLQSAGILIEQKGTVASLNGDTRYFGEPDTVTPLAANKFKLSITPVDADTLTPTNVAATFTIVSVTGTATVAGSSISGTSTSGGTTTATLTLDGEGTVVVQANIPANSTYTSATATGTFVLLPRPITITANNASKPYGTSITPASTAFAVTQTPTTPPAGVTLTSAVMGGSDLVTNVTITSTKGPDASAAVNTYTGDIVPSLPVSGTPISFKSTNYAITFKPGDLTVTQGEATITVDNKSKTYGDLNPTLTAVVTGTTETLNYTLSTTATQFSPVVVGGYPITVTLGSNPNYHVTVVNGTLTINPKAATVVANAKSKTYGDDNPALDAVVTGTVNGDVLAYSLATTAVKFSPVVVGGYPITVTLGSNPNYNVTKTDSTLTINPKAATVVANAKSKTYGDDNPALDAAVTGTVNGDVLAYSLATTAVKFSPVVVGGYPITVTLGSNPNYNVTKTDSTLTITGKDANVAANAKSKTYGDDNPALDATVTGTVNGDVLNYSLATTAVKFSPVVVGGYPITVTLGSNPNYNVTKNDSTLTINPKAANVAANPKSKIYGQNNPALDATVTGTVNGDVLDYSLGTSAVQFSPVGGYPITVTLNSNPNYNVTKNDSTLTITQATPTGVIHGITDKGVDVGGVSGSLSFASVVGQDVVLRAVVSGVGGGGATPTGTVRFWQFNSQAEYYAYLVGIGNGASVPPASLAAATTAATTHASPLPWTTAQAQNYKTLHATNVNHAVAVALSNPALETTALVAGVGELVPLDYPWLAPGNHYLAFDYSGDSNYAAFDPDMTWGVNGSPTQTALTANPDPGTTTITYGTNVIFSAQVTSDNPYLGTLVSAGRYGAVEGSVQFWVDGLLKSTVTVTPGNNGLVTYQTSTLTATGHTVVAKYIDGGTDLSNPPTGGLAYYDSNSNNLSVPIAKKALTGSFTVDNKPYDGDNVAHNIVLGSLTGVVSGDDVHLSGSNATFSDKNVANGKTVTLNDAGLTGANASNYTLNTPLTTTANITKIALTVTADAKSKAYDGTVYSPFTSTITGFITGENAGNALGFGGAPTYSGAATTATNAGTYTNGIVPAVGTLTATNYSFPAANFVPGTLTITKIALTVKADNKSKNYDGAVYSPFTSTITGFITGENAGNAAGFGGAPTYSGVATTATSAGTYTNGIIPAVGTLTATNYSFPAANFLPGTLVISQIDLTITAKSYLLVPYGTGHTANGSADFTVGAGLVSGDSVTSVTLTPGSYAANTAPGSYPITPSAAVGTGVGNYNIHYVAGTFQVVQTTPTGLLHGLTNGNPIDTGTDSSGNVMSFTSVAGQAVTLRADVTGIGGLAPTGTVRFWQFNTLAAFNTYRGGTGLSTAPADVAAANAVNTVPWTKAQANAYKVANATLLVTVNSSSPAPGAYAVSTNTGQWSSPALNYPTLAVGSHLLVFDYSGDTNYNGFDPDMNWGVQQIPTATSVSVNGSPTYGTNPTFTAIVTPSLPQFGNFGSPTYPGHVFVEGSVQFFLDGSLTPFSTVAVTGSGLNDTKGKAVSISVPLPLLSAGAHTILATYSDTGVTYAYGTSSSDSTPFSVGPAASTTIVVLDTGANASNEFVADCKPHGADHVRVTRVGDTALDPYATTITYTGRLTTTYGPSTVKPTVVGFYTATASYPGDANHTSSTGSTDFTITGTAGPSTTGGALYTGSLFFWTTGPSTSTASLALSCTVKALGQCPGDISGATVTFQASNDGGSTFQNIPSAVNQPVGLVVPTDTTVGTASAIAQWNMKANNTVESFLLKIVIGGLYHAGKDANNNEITYIYTVTVAKPLQSQLTVTSLVAGGALKPTPSVSNSDLGPQYPASSGFLGNAPSADANDLTTFSADLSYNKSGTNVQGKATVTFKSFNKADGTVDNVVHTYVATSNSITELTLQATSPKYPVVSFSGKVNLKELLANGSTVSLDAGTMMNVSVIDMGATGDMISIQVQKSQSKGGGLWYSSSWGPAKPGDLPSTLLKPIASGNIEVK